MDVWVAWQHQVPVRSLACALICVMFFGTMQGQELTEKPGKLWHAVVCSVAAHRQVLGRKARSGSSLKTRVYFSCT